VKNVEAFWLGYIFKIYGAKGGLYFFDDFNDLVRVLCGETDREGIYSTEIFEEKSFAFHDGQTSFWTYVAKTQNACPVRHYCNIVPFVSIIEDFVLVFGDVFARL